MRVKINDELNFILYNIFNESIQIDHDSNPDSASVQNLARLKHHCIKYLEQPLIQALNEDI